MSAARAHAILRRAGYAEGGQILKGVTRTVEDRAEPNSRRSEMEGGRDRMSVDTPSGDDAIEWQRTHPNPDPSQYSTSHLPSDLKQRNLLPDEMAGARRGGRISRPGRRRKA